MALHVEVGHEVALQAVYSCDMSSRTSSGGVRIGATSRGGERSGTTSGVQLRYEQQNE